MGKGGGGEALSLFRFHLSPFPPETSDTQAKEYRLERDFLLSGTSTTSTIVDVTFDFQSY